MDKTAFIKKIPKIEDKLFVSKMMDKALKAEETNSLIATDFVDPYQRSVLEKYLKEPSFQFEFYGGYEGAERTIVVFCPIALSFEAYPAFNPPLKLIEARFKTRESITHRDCLGAVMGLGIKREKIGDILVREEFFQMVVMSEIADYISLNLPKVGQSTLIITIKDVSEISESVQRTKEISTTVASLRLDSIASAGFGISRSKMADFIRAEKVSLNWESTNNLTKNVNEGDTISIRGKGRVIVEKIGQTTKKGRIGILLKKLV